jgi:putative oxidoreductase
MLTKLAKTSGRIGVSLVFLWALVDKVTAPSGTIAKIGAAGLPLPGLFYGLTLAALAIGAVGLIAGYKTRWAALILAAWLLPVTLLFHFDLSSQAQTIQLLKNVGLMGALLYIAADHA